MERLKETLRSDHEGFAVTFEVICTLAMITSFLVMIIFFILVMNAQRFMNTVLTTTVAEASRWGGVNTIAYRENVGGLPLLKVAKEQLKTVDKDKLFNATIGGSPDVVTTAGQKVTIWISYTLPTPWQSVSRVSDGGRTGNSVDLFGSVRNMSMQLSASSIMKPGALLTGGSI